MSDKAPAEPQPKKKKSVLGPRARYALFMLAWIALIAAAFNTYFAVKFHKQFVERDQGWSWLTRHSSVGFAVAPDYEAQWDTYHQKSHELGYRIGKDDSASEVVPGGILAVGGSFTYGDAVEHEEAFPAVAAHALGVPVYNYGVGSYSYASVLLVLRDLDERGVLERLAPSVILLGAGNWLVDRSLSPMFPTNGLQFAYPHVGRQGDGLAVLPAPSLYAIDHFWKLADRYYPAGVDSKNKDLTFSRFVAMSRATPRILAARAALKFRYQPGHSGISSDELYGFVIGEMDAIARKHGAQLAVLWMPLFQLELDLALSRSLKLDHVLVDGGSVIRTNGIDPVEYYDRHPTATAHAAYGAAVAEEIRKQREKAD